MALALSVARIPICRSSLKVAALEQTLCKGRATLLKSGKCLYAQEIAPQREECRRQRSVTFSYAGRKLAIGWGSFLGD